MTQYNPVVKAAILQHEITTGEVLRRKPIDYDPITTQWSYNTKQYDTFKNLIKANPELRLRPDKPTKRRQRDPAIKLFEEQHHVRIYGHHVKRIKNGWSCTSQDQSAFIMAPTLHALHQRAPHAFTPLKTHVFVSRQVTVPKIKEVVATIKSTNTSKPPKPPKPKPNRTPLELRAYNLVPGYNVRKRKQEPQWACMTEDRSSSLYFNDLASLFEACPYVLNQ